MSIYQPWTLDVQIAYGKSFVDPPNAFTTWTSLGAPRQWSMARGRQDNTSDYEPGRLTIVLDNGAFDMDQLIVSSPIGNGDALPGTAMRLRATKSGTTVTLFQGFTVDGFTPSSAPLGSGTVACTVVDWLGWAAGMELPGSNWEAWVIGNQPDLYLDGSMERQDPANGDLIYDRAARWSGTSYDGVYAVGSPAVSEDVLRGDSIIPSVTGHSIEFQSSAGATAAQVATTTAPAASGTWGFVMWFQTSTAASFQMGNANWLLAIVAAGHLSMSVVVGGATYTATIAANHADGNPHPVRCSVTSTGGTRTVVLGTDLGAQTANIVNNATSGGGAIAMNIPAATTAIVNIQGFALWGSTIVPSGPTNAQWAAGTETLYQSDIVSNRLLRLCKMAAVTTPTYDITMADPTLTMEAVQGPPSTLADGFQRCGDLFLGATWVTRDGEIRVRDASYTSTDPDDYDTVHAQITDDAAAIAPPVIIPMVSRSRTGTRLDRVVNELTVTLTRDRDLIMWDAASQIAYGIRRKTLSSEAEAAGDVASYAATYLAARLDPVVELGAIGLRPWGNQDITDFVIETVELDRRVTYREATPDDATEIINQDYRIIHEEWSWSRGADWTVTLRLSPVV